MRVMVVGATGALGRPLVRALVARGHEVTGVTRTAGKSAALERAGATPVVVDALDVTALRSAVARAAPEVVVHALTALPPGGPRRTADLEATNRLRRVGTANLVAATEAAGVRRIVAESIVLVYGDGGDDRVTEDHPRARSGSVPTTFAPALDAMRSLEDQVLGAGRPVPWEAVVLRYGMFYGQGAGTDGMVPPLRRRMLPVPGGPRGLWPWLHVEDAATATLAAVEAAAPPRVVNVVDDEPASLHDFVAELARAHGTPPPWTLAAPLARVALPYIVAAAALRLRVGNDRARRELSWTPRYPTYRDGLRDLAAQVTSRTATELVR